ncbi:MAG: sigma-70 family RNA polymerase sigma factor [Planctomycetota bacterium]|nr:MAG: sigma-70 family RNA polymerase sigma factor [Planctomycetota bacterium]
MALTDIDRRLLKQCLARAPGAWKDFVDRFVGLFVHVIRHTAHARSIKIGSDDLDDLCSEVFVRLIDHDFAILRRFREQSSLATYLTVVARRIVVKEMIRRRKAEAWGHVDAHGAALESAGESMPIASSESVEEIALLLENLPTQDAQIVRKFHLEGKTYREISAELGISENSVGPTLTRAREKLKQLRVGVD